MATTSPTEIPDELRVGLRHYWYPVLPSAELPTHRPIGIGRLDEELVLWRDADGLAHTFVDRCAHRGARLSRKTDSEEEREPSRELLETFYWQAFSQVFDEDSWVVDNQGGLDRALGDEHLLKTDAGPLRVRKLILDTYRAQQARLAEQRGSIGEGNAPAAVETVG